MLVDSIGSRPGFTAGCTRPIDFEVAALRSQTALDVAPTGPGNGLAHRPTQHDVVAHCQVDIDARQRLVVGPCVGGSDRFGALENVELIAPDGVDLRDLRRECHGSDVGLLVAQAHLHVQWHAFELAGMIHLNVAGVSSPPE